MARLRGMTLALIGAILFAILLARRLREAHEQEHMRHLNHVSAREHFPRSQLADIEPASHILALSELCHVCIKDRVRVFPVTRCVEGEMDLTTALV